MNHSWTPVKVKLNSAVCEGFRCDNCEYFVVAYRDKELGGGSAHIPTQKLIVMDADRITAQDAEELTRVHGVKCKD